MLAVEQKFFCDRTTEKTVTLTVTDNQNSPVTFTNSTVRLSCQYPLSAVKDLSESNENNVYNNSWHYIKVEETDCASEVLCKNKLYDNGTVIAREYEASLSARKDERIRFHVKFSKGSHMNFTWMFDEDLGSNHPHVKYVRISSQSSELSIDILFSLCRRTKSVKPRPQTRPSSYPAFQIFPSPPG